MAERNPSPGAATVSGTADREIVQTRLLNAPRDLVFTVWTDPRHVAVWWGPNGFTTTGHSMDARPGGVWRFVMHGPDGTDYRNKVVYLEVARPERLVYDHGEDDGGVFPMFRVTVRFDDEGGKTRLTMTSLFPNPEARARVVEFGAVELGRQTIDRLEAYLAEQA